MTDVKLRDMLRIQLSIDYNCFLEDFDNPDTLITARSFNAERRMFEEDDCIASLIVHDDKLIVTVEDEFFDSAEEFFEDSAGKWSFDITELSALNDVLSSYGYELGAARVGYLPRSRKPAAEQKGNIVWLEGAKLESFRGDERFNEALLFSRVTPDMLAVAYYNDKGDILGMAGASRNCPAMWEMGVNVVPEARREGIGSMLVALLAEEVLKRGHLPYFNCCMSHIAAQRTAIAAGLCPAFCEVRAFPVRPESPFED